MNCGDVDRMLTEDPSMISSSVQLKAHLTACSGCRELVAATDFIAMREGPSDADLRKIEKLLASNLEPVRPLAPRRTLSLVFVVIIALILLVIFGIVRIGAYGLGAMSTSQASLLLSGLALGLLLLCDSLARQMAPGSNHPASPNILPFGIALLLVTIVGAKFPSEPDDRFFANSWICIKIGAGIGACAALPFWFVLRRGAALSPATTGLGAGLMAGLVGTTALQIHCPNLDVWHILLSHVGPAILWSLTGLLTACGLQLVDRRTRASGFRN